MAKPSDDQAQQLACHFIKKSIDEMDSLTTQWLPDQIRVMTQYRASATVKTLKGVLG